MRYNARPAEGCRGPPAHPRCHRWQLCLKAAAGFVVPAVVAEPVAVAAAVTSAA